MEVKRIDSGVKEIVQLYVCVCECIVSMCHGEGHSLGQTRAHHPSYTLARVRERERKRSVGDCQLVILSVFTFLITNTPGFLL